MTLVRCTNTLAFNNLRMSLAVTLAMLARVVLHSFVALTVFNGKMSSRVYSLLLFSPCTRIDCSTDVDGSISFVF